MAREILGHIDCPHCGTAKGMRITPDRNGAPFGYCEANCSGQLKVGGDARRVAAFVARYPWAAGKPVAAPDTVPAPATAKGDFENWHPGAPPTGKAPAPAPAPAKPKSSNPFDFLLNQGKA